MPFTSSHTEDSPRSHERRRFIRQRVRSLAYLDVIPNNGGIVLNLSENGLALQAVNPFDETRLSLRIQPPTSRRRIEASAEITWLSESKTQAGLHFLELTESARLELADWIAAESGADTPRPVDDPPILPAPQVASERVAVEPPRVRQKWSVIVGDSLPQPTRSNQQAPEHPANSEVPREGVELRDDIPRTENLPTRSTNVPAANIRVMRPATTNENVEPVNALAPSASTSRVVEFPTMGSHAPAVNDLLRELSSQVPAAASGEAAEVHSTVVPAVNVESLKLLAHRFRKPLAIGALSASAAVIFLIVGLALIHQRPAAGPAKLAAQEAVQVPDVASTSRVARDRSSLAAASKSPTSSSDAERGKTAGAIASAPHRESSEPGYGRSAYSSHQVDTSNSLVGKSSSLIEPASLGPTNHSPDDATAASKPVLSIGPTSIPHPVGDSAEINPPATSNIQRRTDCYLLYRVEPLYPREAKAHHVEGTVTIHLQIGTDGRVQNLRELSGPSLLVPAALDAAREWRFIPALVDGQAVEAEKDVSIAFQLPH